MDGRIWWWQVTDEKLLIDEFEAGHVSPVGFHHADHVKLAFVYLLRYSPLEALSKFCAALKHFAAVQGKAER